MAEKTKNNRVRILIELLLLSLCLGVLFICYNKSYICNTQNSSGSASTLYYQGKSWEAQGKYDKAREAFKKTIKLNPNFGNAHLMLGVVYTRKGEFKDAEKEYRKALE